MLFDIMSFKAEFNELLKWTKEQPRYVSKKDEMDKAMLSWRSVRFKTRRNASQCRAGGVLKRHHGLGYADFTSAAACTGQIAFASRNLQRSSVTPPLLSLCFLFRASS